VKALGLRGAIGALAALGLAIAGYLSWVHYSGIEPLCTGISDCERVRSSDYAKLAGLPVALIEAICQWCVASAVIMVTLALLATLDVSRSGAAAAP